MRLAVVIVLLAACKGEPKQEASAAAMPPEPVVPAEAASPPSDMDEKMRHCPLSIPGTTVTVSDVDGGVRFELRGDAATRDELVKRGRHVVQFAACAAAHDVHGGGQGGGKMRNCPVVTNGVAIAFDEATTTLTVKPASGGNVDELRRETKARLDRFAFDGVKIERR